MAVDAYNLEIMTFVNSCKNGDILPWLYIAPSSSYVCIEVAVLNEKQDGYLHANAHVYCLVDS